MQKARKKKQLWWIFIVVAMLLACIPVFAIEKTSAESITTHDTEDHIYMFGIREQDDAFYPYGNMILIESNGLFGLIDTKYHFLDKVNYTKSQKVKLPKSEYLSDLSNSGLDWCGYIQETLGVTHLDFVLSTNTNAENFGGVADICDLKSNNEPLVDDQTVFFYKAYQPINSRQDVLRRSNMLQRAALYAMEKNGAVLMDVSQGYAVSDINEQDMQYFDSNILTNLSEVNWITSFSFKQEEPGATDDYFELLFGDFTIRFYNLYHWETKTNDNVNSIVITITKDEQTIVLLSNLNNEFQVGELIAEEIAKETKGSRVSILQTSSLGTEDFSITKKEADIYQPQICITPNVLSEENCQNNSGNFKEYCEDVYQTKFYDGNTSLKAVMLVIGENEVEVKNLCKSSKWTYTEPSEPNKAHPADGLHYWETTAGNPPLWYDYQQGKIIKDRWVGTLYFDENGLCTNIEEVQKK